MQATARPANHSELVQAIGIRDRQHIACYVCDPPAFQAVRFLIARPIEGDQPETHPVQRNASRQRASWCSMQEKHRSTLRGTPRFGGESPTIGRSYRTHRLITPSWSGPSNLSLITA